MTRLKSAEERWGPFVPFNLDNCLNPPKEKPELAGIPCEFCDNNEAEVMGPDSMGWDVYCPTCYAQWVTLHLKGK